MLEDDVRAVPGGFLCAADGRDDPASHEFCDLDCGAPDPASRRVYPDQHLVRARLGDRHVGLIQRFRSVVFSEDHRSHSIHKQVLPEMNSL